MVEAQTEAWGEGGEEDSTQAGSGQGKVSMPTATNCPSYLKDYFLQRRQDPVGPPRAVWLGQQQDGT